MKSIPLPFIFFLLVIQIQAQDFYGSILIDSSRYTRNLIEITLEDSINASYSAYDYDDQDRVIQRRSTSLTTLHKVDYTYDSDTTYSIFSILDTTSGNFGNVSRTKQVFENGKIKSALREKYENNNWTKSRLETYDYNSQGLETAYIKYLWGTHKWDHFSKIEHVYDSNGNNIEIGEYTFDAVNNPVYKKGSKYEYDDANRKIQSIDDMVTINGIIPNVKLNWMYRSDNLLDSFQRSSYSYTNGNYTNKLLLTYEYSQDESITVSNWYTWTSGIWDYNSRTFSFKGEELYSSHPDSVLAFYYWSDSMIHVPSNKEYYTFEELGNGQVFYKKEKYNRDWSFQDSTVWRFVELDERWFHFPASVNSNEITENKNSVQVFPNPCKSGQEINLKLNLPSDKNYELLIFDINGRLVGNKLVYNNSKILAPKTKGIYSLLIKSQSEFIGVKKLSVID